MAVTMTVTSVGLLTVVIFMLTIGQGSALRCWTCSSTSDKACHDPFNKTHMSNNDCDAHRSPSSHSAYSTAVCKKLKYRESGELVTIRQCDWINDYRSDSRDEKRQSACASSSVPSYRKVEYCETCTEDSCNGSNRDVIASTWCAFVPLIIYLCSKKTV